MRVLVSEHTRTTAHNTRGREPEEEARETAPILLHLLYRQEPGARWVDGWCRDEERRAA